MTLLSNPTTTWPELAQLTPLTPIATGLKQSGEPTAVICALLFDIYGTLFISASGDIATAQKLDKRASDLERLLQDFSIEESTTSLRDRFYNHIKKEHIRLKKEGIDYPEVKIDRIWADVLQLDDLEQARNFAGAFEMAVNPVYPMPHLEQALATIENQNLAGGIISNAQFYTERLFELFLGKNPGDSWAEPDLIFYSYRHGRGKPSLYLFEQAVAALNKKGIKPQNTLYVGNDMLNDIYPARMCGFQTALFAGDKRSLRLRKDEPRCRGIAPDITITDLEQLEEIIVLSKTTHKH